MAVAIARVASGHSVLWNDAVHAAQKTSATILRTGGVARYVGHMRGYQSHPLSMQGTLDCLALGNDSGCLVPS